MKKRNSGFTLIEMLLVMAMLAVVSLAIYTMFSNSVKIWQRIHMSIPVEDVDIFFEKFTSDIKNSMKFKTIGFSGKEESLGFAAPVYSARMDKRTVGEIRYTFNPYSGKVKREIRDYSQAYLGEEKAAQELLTSVKEFKIRYYTYDVEKKEYIWQNEWQGEGLPLAVKVEIEIKNDNEQAEIYARTVSIPVGG